MSFGREKTSCLNQGILQDNFSRLLWKANQLGKKEGAYLDSERAFEMLWMPQM
jgi:hypothetical protein